MTGEFYACENEQFLDCWSERYITITEDVQPSLQEEIQASIDDTLRVYRASNLFPFFVMYVDSDCPSPSFALINQDTVWNNRSLSCYLLDHHSRVPPGQFNDTTIRVPSATKLCPKRNCPCPKKHLQKLDKKHIFQIAVEEKKEGAETILRSVMCRDDLVLSQTGYSVLHIPKSQTTFITSFNDRRTRICGALRMFF